MAALAQKLLNLIDSVQLYNIKENQRSIMKTKAILFLISSVFLLAYPVFLAPQVWAGKAFYSIQVGSSKNLQSTEQKIKRLRQAGHDVFYRIVKIKQRGTFYRIFISRHNSYKVAQQQARQLKQSGVITDYFVRKVKDQPTNTTATSKAASPKADSTAQGSRTPEPKTASIQNQPDKPIAEAIKPAGAQNKQAVKVDKPAVIQTKTIAKAPKPAVLQTKPSVLLKHVTFKKDDDGTETVLIQCDRNFYPDVRFALQGPAPKLIVEIAKSYAHKEQLDKISVNGKLIKQIRPRQQTEPTIVQVEVMLKPGLQYAVTQRLIVAANTFAIDITSIIVKAKP